MRASVDGAGAGGAEGTLHDRVSLGGGVGAAAVFGRSVMSGGQAAYLLQRVEDVQSRLRVGTEAALDLFVGALPQGVGLLAQSFAGGGQGVDGFAGVDRALRAGEEIAGEQRLDVAGEGGGIKREGGGERGLGNGTGVVKRGEQLKLRGGETGGAQRVFIQGGEETRCVAGLGAVADHA